MSQPKTYSCLNNPLEFWTVFKIPQAVLAAPAQHPQTAKPGPSTRIPSPPLLQLPTELLLAIFQQTAAPNPDPLDQLALALTCKPLLAVAAAFSSAAPGAPSSLPPGIGGGIPVPSIRDHRYLEPPCPAITRLQAILASFSATPTPTPHGPQPSSDASRPQLLHDRDRLARQRGVRYYFGACLPSDLGPLPVYGQDDDTHPRNLVYCPACCHLRPRASRYWQRHFSRVRHLRALLIAPPRTSLQVIMVVELWERKAHIDCPECWAEAVLMPSLPQPQPQPTGHLNFPNLRNGRNSLGFYDFAYWALSAIRGQ